MNSCPCLPENNCHVMRNYEYVNNCKHWRTWSATWKYPKTGQQQFFRISFHESYENRIPWILIDEEQWRSLFDPMILKEVPNYKGRKFHGCVDVEAMRSTLIAWIYHLKEESPKFLNQYKQEKGRSLTRIEYSRVQDKLETRQEEIWKMSYHIQTWAKEMVCFVSPDWEQSLTYQPRY